MRHVDTVIVGGGVSGLACARRLHQQGYDFQLVTDRLGGRLYASADGVNFGAAYVTRDYHHICQFVTLGPAIPIRDQYFFDGSRYVTLFDLRNLGRAVGLLRLYRQIIRTRRALNRLRLQAPYRCQKELMEADPDLPELTSRPAADMVRDLGIEELNETYCGPLLYCTVYAQWQEVNVFYYCAVLFPGLVATYYFDPRGAIDRLTEGFSDRIVKQKATAIEEFDGGGAFRVEHGDGELSCRNLVLAIPNRNAEGLFPVPGNARDLPYGALHIRGTRRPIYRPGKTIFPRADHPVRCLWPQLNGVDIAFCATQDPDLSEYYEQYEIIDHVMWKTAVQLSGAEWRPLQPRPNLFTIGDHNVIGLEDSYLTGLFAANRILGITDRTTGITAQG